MPWSGTVSWVMQVTGQLTDGSCGSRSQNVTHCQLCYTHQLPLFVTCNFLSVSQSWRWLGTFLGRVRFLSAALIQTGDGFVVWYWYSATQQPQYRRPYRRLAALQEGEHIKHFISLFELYTLVVTAALLLVVCGCQTVFLTTRHHLAIRSYFANATLTCWLRRTRCLVLCQYLVATYKVNSYLIPLWTTVAQRPHEL